MFFKSAVDSWLYILAVSLPLIVLRALTPTLAEAQVSTILYSVLAIAPLVLIPAWLLVSTYYRVDSAIMRVQAGPFSWSIPLDQIRNVTAKRSLSAAPSLSANRLKIDYGRQRSILVSPKNRAAFIAAIGHQPADVLTEASAQQFSH
ncbi:MAG: PH domain-containing protein [Phormidesmis sp.]